MTNATEQRHGEKPADGGDGLNAQGMQRAQCLRNVFGASSQYNIGYILAETPKSSESLIHMFTVTGNHQDRQQLTRWPQGGKRRRPVDTVTPLANDLGLSVDTHCDRDDPDCVKDAVSAYKGSGNVLICWEHDALQDICKELGKKSSNCPNYPDDSFNIIWTDPAPYNNGVVSSTSEMCPGLDN
ncbi:hypothetical protein FH972_021289 [Carpinus fangiana]|uniref:Uncharacterized protein n=1 Tax=Carpinus fangiana TaxID=176857 RepID=A0A5N6KPH8_9ROSI|nr:hypothetical protein FH972_021289 [Carpinus fangiana]